MLHLVRNFPSQEYAFRHAMSIAISCNGILGQVVERVYARTRRVDEAALVVGMNSMGWIVGNRNGSKRRRRKQLKNCLDPAKCNKSKLETKRKKEKDREET